MSTSLAIFGGTGSGAIVAQSVSGLVDFGQGIELVGFLNDVLPAGSMISGAPVLGPFSSWKALAADVEFLAPLHSVEEMPARFAVVGSLGVPAERWTTIIDRLSSVAPDAEIGRGCFIGPFASVGPGAKLGAHTIVRAGAHVSHDCTIGDFAFVGTNAVVCGYSTVDDGAYIAPNATIRDRCRVGEYAVVGLGSVVTKDVPAFEVVIGVPARRQRLRRVRNAVE